MRRMTRQLHRSLFRRSQTGQAIILLAFGVIALLIFIGLVTDIGVLLVRFNQLRRAVDSASIAAAGQIRENRSYADIALTARQFIRMHDLDPDRVIVETCQTTPDDPALCPNEPRKLVRVTAQIDSPTTFLRLIPGFEDTITLEASSIAETAVLDVALVLDTSESMSRDTEAQDYTDALGGVPIRAECGGADPRWSRCCNDIGNGTVDDAGVISGVSSSAADGNFSDLMCQPFKGVRDAARNFVFQLDFIRGDRVAFVTFDRYGTAYAPTDPVGGGTLEPLITSRTLAIDTLNRYVGVHDEPAYNAWSDCYTLDWDYNLYSWTYDWLAPCPDTNIGGGILTGMNTLIGPNYIREEAVQVMIVLSDGGATATDAAMEGDTLGLVVAPPAPNAADRDPAVPAEYGAYGYCPWWTFCDMGAHNPDQVRPEECTAGQDQVPNRGENPVCSDPNPYTRHTCITTANDAPRQPGLVRIDAANCDLLKYDATDYAMDAADAAGLVEVMPGVDGNFIAMYTIGFGDDVPPHGETLLRYVADAGDNGIIDNNWDADCRNDFICDNEREGLLPDLIVSPWLDRHGLENTAAGAYNPLDYPDEFGPPGPCEYDVTTDTAYLPGDRQDCGQYWYASGAGDLNRVFAEIASRLFTRLSR